MHPIPKIVSSPKERKYIYRRLSILSKRVGHADFFRGFVCGSNCRPLQARTGSDSDITRPSDRPVSLALASLLLSKWFVSGKWKRKEEDDDDACSVDHKKPIKSNGKADKYQSWKNRKERAEKDDGHPDDDDNWRHSPQ